MKKSNPILRILSWVVLIGLGFFVGTAWKATDTDQQAVAESPDTEIVDEESAPNLTQVNNTLTSSSNVSRKGLNSEETATIKLFEEAAPSVAFITTSNFRKDYFTMNVTEIPSGTGSAFIWDKQGHVVTNYHVIKGADRAKVTLADQSVWDAELVGKAPEKDLAVLKIDAPKNILRPISVGMSEELLVGQSVYAIGNPFGLDQTLTTGIISALGREIQSQANIPIRGAIQTDAAINPGNSGGPLLDSSGELIGVNTAIYSPSGAYAGIGFSIPVDVVSWVVPDLIKYGKIKRPVMGIEMATTRLQNRLGIKGVLIINVIEGSGAERAGIQPTQYDRYGSVQLGDIIVAVNDEAIKTRGDLLLSIEEFEAGDMVNVTVLRNDEEITLSVKLDSM